MSKKIYVCGGGASGMCAAIYAARNGAKVCIIEKNDCLGKKLSMTGNGRCNLTNLNMSEDCYNAAARSRMKDWLGTYGAEDVICFFKSLGVVVKSEDGYIYPVSGQAKTVVDALKNEIKRLGVEVVYKEQLKSVAGLEDGSLEIVTDKSRYQADRSIIAVGSLSGVKSTMSTGDGYYICKKLGMTIKDTFPALVGFKCEEDEYLPEKGVRCDARISFILGSEVLSSEQGELQITSDGISGIPVMQASRDVIRFVEEKKPVYAAIDFFPDYDENDFACLKKDMLRLKDERTIEEFLLGFANQGVTDMILARMKISKTMKMKNISDSFAECILDSYRNLKIKIEGSYGYQASQVTAGGVSIAEVGSDFSFNKNRNIYVIGELLDVDGRCGGYNLQFAFTSGSIAGCASSL
ncbi:MAG: aminoacetone oxidase family FAD-binding enzyme [Butyrivibrio sp.]|uniref:aminoacetone oxidase family FAD-binding enzyme n=1 Tax=Butyrivibrio sp. TaxID=28121 RepID=UPI001B46AD1D|nr:aminoacetone oxidase family FAD-binding enzyme [Butyrivibrio sp.]MBP3782030.1 aminoacetone oxidase family FAD-binding enzyme [Butyrivibrio sp.]